MLPAYERGLVHKLAQCNFVAVQLLGFPFENKLPVASIDAFLNCHIVLADTTLLQICQKALS